MRYHITYRVDAHPEGLTREEVEAKGDIGACTAVLIASLIYPPDGSFGCMFVSEDGRTEEDLAAGEIWKIWSLLAAHLAEREDLADAKRDFCRDVWETISTAVRRARSAGDA